VTEPLTPTEELPPWILSSLLAFLDPFFAGNGPDAYSPVGGSRDFVREVERTCRVPLPRQHGDRQAASTLYDLIQSDPELLARVLDYALANIMLGYEGMNMGAALRDLQAALAEGSNYEVVQPDQQRWAYRLQRRTPVVTSAAVSAQTAVGDDAGRHLDKAWQAAYGREPNPKTAYAEAILAVEAVSIPIVTPNDGDATLGKVIGQLRSTPVRFEAVFHRDTEPARGESLSPVQTITALADLLWSNHTERHAPIQQITQQQAEFAVHLALVLVQAFRSSVKPKS